MNKQVENGLVTKKRKTRSNSESDEAEMAAASNDQQTAEILRLDVDCCGETFDYLSFDDLISVGQTCKQMHQIVGHILQQSYRGTQLVWKSTGENVPINHFKQFIEKIQIEGTDTLDDFHHVQSKFHQLKRIDLIDLDLAAANLENIKEIFKTVEHLALFDCTLDGNFHSSILAMCPKIKRFTVYPMKSRTNIIIGNGNDWLHKTYSMLEYFEIHTDSKRLKIDELRGFLERNPNIQDLSVSDKFLKTNKHSLLAANVTLNNLAISINLGLFDAELFHLIKQFHERRLFRRLKLYFSCAKLKQKHINQLATLNVLVKLQVACIDSVKLSSLNSIEELYVGESQNIADLSDLAMNLQNLERIEFFTAFSDEILAFIRHSVKLKKVRVFDFGDGIHFNTDTKIVDLVALNKEREQLNGAQKLTFYVKEDIYLATKWALKATDFSLIRLKREKSFE